MNKYIYLLILMALLTSNKSNAADAWTKEQVISEMACLTVRVIDWGQTRDIAKNPDKYYETNPILGEHPSVSEVDLYFLVGTILHIGITHVLPSEYRKYWQGLTFGISTAFIINNNSIGLRINF